VSLKKFPGLAKTTRNTTVVVVATTVVLFGSSAGRVRAQQSVTQNPLIGTWRLISFEARAETGEVSRPMGEHPVGVLTYDLKGRVANQLMQPNRPAFKSGDRRGGTAEEIKAAFEGFAAYAGTYRVDWKQETIVHYVDVSSFPNEVGADLERFFEISGRRITFRTPRRVLAGQTGFSTLVWERVD
jgi:hypothetical protein